MIRRRYLYLFFQEKLLFLWSRQGLWWPCGQKSDCIHAANIQNVLAQIEKIWPGVQGFFIFN